MERLGRVRCLKRRKIICPPFIEYGETKVKKYALAFKEFIFFLGDNRQIYINLNDK